MCGCFYAIVCCVFIRLMSFILVPMVLFLYFHDHLNSTGDIISVINCVKTGIMDIKYFTEPRYPDSNRFQ